MDIRRDDLRGPEVAQLLQQHLDDMAKHSPAESVHALDLDALRQPHVRFWSLWLQGQLAGCGALSLLDTQHAEIKSMRTADAFLRRGVAATLLQHLIDDARAQGLQRLSLETGSPAPFEAARQLYHGFGFHLCAPFGHYTEDPYSVFMTREI